MGESEGLEPVQVLPENLDEAQVPVKPVEPPAQEAQPAPQVDIDAIVEERLSKRTEEIESRLGKRLEDVYSRIKQGQRDSMAHLRKEYLDKAQVIDELATSGTLPQEEADRKKSALRDQLDRTVLQAEQQQQAAQTQQDLQAQQSARANQTAFNSYCNRVVSDLELLPNDPEVKELMGKHYDTEDAAEAQSLFLRDANKAARKKDKRTAQDLSAQLQDKQEKREVAQGKAVPIFTGASGSTKPPTEETIRAELNKLLESPEVRDPAKAKAWQKRVDELADAMNKLGGVA